MTLWPIRAQIAEVKKEKKNIEKDLEAVTEEWEKARLNGELRAATSQLYSASGLAKVRWRSLMYIRDDIRLGYEQSTEILQARRIVYEEGNSLFAHSLW